MNQLMQEYVNANCSPEDVGSEERTLRMDTHTARSPKHCDHCEGTINTGQKYTIRVYLDDFGTFVTERWHADFKYCQEMCAAVEKARQEAEREFSESLIEECI